MQCYKTNNSVDCDHFHLKSFEHINMYVNVAIFALHFYYCN